MSPEPLLSVEDLAVYLGVTRDTVYNWINTKDLPSLKIGKLWKFRQADIDTWLDKTFKQNSKTDELSWEENWRPLVDLTTDMLCLAGSDGYFKQLNPAWASTLGWTIDELKSKKWIEFVHPDDLEATLESGATLQEGKHLFQFENRYICKDGSYRWLCWNSVPSEDGSIIFAVARDITAIRQTRNELHHTSEQLSVILDSVPSLVFYKDTENRFIRVNRALSDLMGIPKNKLEGVSCFDLYPKDQATKYWHDDLELIKNNRPQKGILEPVTSPEGERWFITDKIPYIDREGKIKGVIGVSTDITKLKQTEHDLRLFERVVASNPDMISLVDSNYTYTYVNDSYTTTWQKPKSEIVGRHIEDLIGKDVFQTVIKPRLSKALKGNTNKYENWFETPSRGRRYLEVTYHPVTDDNGSCHHVVVNARDITIRKQAEDEIQLQKDRISMASSAGGIGVWEWIVGTDKLHWDEGMFNLYQFPQDACITYQTWRDVVYPDDVDKIEKALEETLKTKKTFESEFRIIVSDGSVKYIRAAAKLRKLPNSPDEHLIGVNWDITEQKTLEAKIRNLANTDPLTGAQNRRQFVKRGSRELKRSKRYHTDLALLLIDLDRFKNINDTYGHDVGDKVLIEFVKICQGQLRSPDMICRLGGEEFAVLLPETDKNNAMITAERLRKSIEETAVLLSNNRQLSYTFSAGLTMALESDKEIESMIKRADKALYKAKENGRNQIMTSS